jgi:uncharacterized protein YifE (UPF0438 family)
MTVNNNMNFENINTWLSGKKNIWIMGEREWTAQLAKDFFENHKTGRKYNKIDDNLKGVFLLQELPKDINDLENCNRLYFFNSKEQLFALKDGENFLTKESNISEEKIYLKTIKNIKKPKDYYKFKFASQIDVIPTNLENNSIFVILDEKTGDWRFSHE